MKSILCITTLLASCLITSTSCKREDYSPEKASFASGNDLIMEEMTAYRSATRQLYDQGKFAELDARAEDARNTKAKFANGEWKLAQFYDALRCQPNGPESAWKRQEEVHQDWAKNLPDSITARVAQADFLANYAWHARGTSYANEVSEESWKLFADRLSSARTVLDHSKNFITKCPEWWQVRMTVALGQSWSVAELEAVFQEAKALDPTYYYHDLIHAKFLMPRYHGELGDWEAAAEREIARPNGLGHAGYARVVSDLRGYYDDIFSESKASWPAAQQGYEELRKQYPDSAEILNDYARMACAADDKPLANKLFAEIGPKVLPHIWGGRKRFSQMQRWARN